MKELKPSEFKIIFSVLIISAICLALVIFTNWNRTGPYFTIIMSIELGVIVTLALFINANQKRIQLYSPLETPSSRISELNTSFQKISKELIKIHEELQFEIESSQSQLDSLQSQTKEISKKRDDLKKELEVLEETKPELVQYLVEQVKASESRGIIINLVLFCLGVISPYAITYIQHFFSL